jgi:quinol monooxygenase YgiN
LTITIMVHAIVKKEYLEEYLEMASQLTRETKTNRSGCISYSINQRQDKPTEFVLYEQWESQGALDEHIRQLVILLGPPKPGGLLPEKLVNMYERGVPYYYNVIE